MQFPYQIVAFFGVNPDIGTTVYDFEGDNKKWLPHVALKRKFRLNETSQNEMVSIFKEIAAKTQSFEIMFKYTTKPEHMPVEVVEVKQNQDLIHLHRQLFEKLGLSKYPEREGENYYPHMTVSWKGMRVIDPQEFEGTVHQIKEIYIIKEEDNDSAVLTSASLENDS